MTNVRNLLILLLSLWSTWATGQPDTSIVDWSNKYKKELQKIENLEQQGQNRSAYNRANDLFDQAINEQNIPGIIGAVNLLIRNIYRVEDEASEKVLVKIADVKPGHPVVSAVINTYLAELLTQFYERNRYRISSIQITDDIPWENVSRWSSTQIEQTIDRLYRQSVEPTVLKRISSENIKALMADRKTAIHYELRPRLYDLLQMRYLEYLQNGRLHWSIQTQVPDAESARLLHAIDLSEYLKTTDPTDRIYPVIRAFHDWESSLQESKWKSAYVDVILQRIRFISDYLGDQHLLAAIPLLQRLTKNFSNVPNRLAIDHQCASIYYQKGDFPKALQILNAGLKKKPENAYQNTVGQIQQMIRNIKAPELNVQSEDAYPTDQKPLVSIHFRNINQLRLELYPLTEEEFVKWRYSDEAREKDDFQLTRGKEPFWKKTLDLPVSHDFKSHRTEVLIDQGLKKGVYAIRYFYKRDKIHISGIVLFQVTDLALVRMEDDQNSMLLVLNRKTGARIKKAQVEGITITRYPTFRRNEVRILREKEGGLFLPPDKQMNLYYRVSNGSDLYISPLTYQRSLHHSPDQPFRRSVLLTDRSVYKPGQTIHFKALAVLSQRLDSKLIKEQEISISLRDANGKEVWQKSYQTDEWGSATGTVPIPSSGLKGHWMLQASPSGQATIQVEEYQRPNFEVEVPDSSVQRQDSMITIEGEAMTFHGFPVQNGKGSIQVELQRRYWFYGMQPDKGEVVHSGLFMTDENGRFQVDFKQVNPPNSVHRYSSFYFYVIHISVQAASGEIREITRTIPLDPDKILVRTDVPAFQLLHNMAPLRFSVRNAMQEPASREVRIEVAELRAPEQYKVERYWGIPDQPIYTARRFQKEIDYLFYDHEANMEDWEVQRQTKSWTKEIADQDSLDLATLFDQPGYYRIIIRSEKGDTLSSASFGLMKDKSANIVHAPLEILSNKSSAQPGDNISLNVFFPKMLVGGQMMINRPGERSEWHNLRDKKSIDIKITEQDRGGIYIRAYGFLQNRFYEKTVYIDVPWSNKKLDLVGLKDLARIEVSTDTALNIKVFDNNQKGVESEVAMVIYDASLDAYRPHDWSIKPPFFRGYINPLRVDAVTGHMGDHVVGSNNYWKYRIQIVPLILPQLPHLQWGYGGILYSRRDAQYMVKSVAPSAEAGAVTMDDMESDEASLVEEGQLKNESLLSDQFPIRKDFAETILFSGKVYSDSNGAVRIPFHTNDKAGRWKVLVFAHNEDLSTGVVEHSFETYQELILESYMPRMVRQGDQMDLTFTLYNNASRSLSGQVQFEMKPLFADQEGETNKKNLGFDLEAGKSTVLTLPVRIGVNQSNPLIFSSRVVDDDGKVWDATEEIVPVYPATEKVHDGQVVILRSGENWSGEDIPDLVANSTGQVSIRIVQNMYSELIKSIPYLQYHNPVTTDQFFRNGTQAILGQYITHQIPDFEFIYNEWKRKGELESRLKQNQDKKYVSLDNTPWVRQSDSGTEQMALLGLYFDKSHMNQIIEENMDRWVESQNPDGGFPWIKNGSSSFFITLRFLAMANQMERVGLSLNPWISSDQQRKAQDYLDMEFLRLWKKMKQDSRNSMIYYQRFISYFTEKSYGFDEDDVDTDFLDAWEELRDSIYANWSDYHTGMRADIGIASWQLGDKDESRKIVNALLDNAIKDPELGVYWRYNHQGQQSGYLGVLAGIIKLLDLHDENSLNEGITRWVLVNKMTNDWQQNPHVTSLMLSLLKMKGDWTTASRSEVVSGGQKRIWTGVGDAGEIVLNTNELESFHLNHLEGPPIWVGIITSREVEPEDAVTQSGDIIRIKKSVTGSDNAGELEKGDQLTVRLILKADRDLDYVYVADPVVPGMDAGISLSGFHWDLGLSYYQSFGDAAAEFFIDHLPKGEHILEYRLGVVREGVFRSPFTKVQSYFVPEINGVDQWRSKVEIGR